LTNGLLSDLGTLNAITKHYKTGYHYNRGRTVNSW